MRTITIEQGTKDSRYTWNNSETKQEPKAKKKKIPEIKSVFMICCLTVGSLPHNIN